MNNEPKVILDTSPEAASIQTLTGWVSSTGQFWGGNERAARFDGSTHTACQCGQVIERPYTSCETCREKRYIERYLAKERKAWDGEAMLFSDSHDQYFSDINEVLDYCYDHDCTPEELRLIICEPQFAPWLDIDAHCEQVLCEDETAPKELRAAADAFNKAVKDYGKPLSWMPGKFALDISEITLEPAQS